MELEENLRLSLLMDFYSPLLTDKQREVLNDFIINNLSISEIAGNDLISRQAINDLIKRTIKTLEKYESKLGLLKKYQEIKSAIEKVLELLHNNAEKDSIIKMLNSVLEVV